MRQPSPPGSKATLIALMFAGLAVVSPFALRGIACGRELSFHMDSWMEVAQQWRQGVAYPQWAAYANYRGGDPRFLFYPPLSWILGGALGSFLPWLFVPVAFDVCIVVLAGWLMYFTAREWFEQPEAALIAVAYALNPYMLATIYARSAFAEMLAASLFPLLLLWVVRDRPAQRMLAPLALTIAAIWLTNLPAAIIATYFVVVLLVVVTLMRRSSRVFLYGIAAIGLGLALASFFLVPAFYERNWVMLGRLATSSLPQGNFLFSSSGRFPRTLSWLAIAEVAATAVAIAAARKSWRENSRLCWSLTISAAISSVLMLPAAGLAYRLMPDLHAVEFPWRWLLVISVAYAVFVVTALPSFRGKAWLYAFVFVALTAGCNHVFQTPCDPAETPFMVSNVYRTGYGYMGPGEYVTVAGANYAVKPDFPEFRFFAENGSIATDARVTHWLSGPYRKQLTVESSKPLQLVLRLMNYPGWRVEANGKLVATATDRTTGRMVIELPSGTNHIDVRFVRTADRWIGDGISLAALLALCWYGFYSPRRHRKHGIRSEVRSHASC
jgi:hypothetical protein